jgi:hypothetical protein
MKMSKLFWGLLVIGAGILLLLSALGLGGESLAIPIIGSALLLAVAIASLTKFRFVLFFIPLAFIAYIWRGQIGYENLGLWPLLGAAVLLGIGLSVIFHKKPSVHITVPKNDSFGRTEETYTENEFVNISSSWGEHIKYIHANNLKKAEIYSSCADTRIYFDQCQASPEGLEIQVNANLTQVVLIVPRSWVINSKISIFAAEVSNPAPARPEQPVNVNLTGKISLAELRIEYV